MVPRRQLVPGRSALAVGLAIAACVPAASAASEAVSGDGSAASPYVVPELDGRVTIDGVLDDPIWDDALVLDLAYETHPGENTPAPVQTKLYMVSSPTHLYAAFDCADPDPSKICSNICERDAMYDGDRVVLILDTFNDQRRSYMLFANAHGIQGDALDVAGMGAGDATWDAIWDSAGRIGEGGYVVELAIPFSSIRFQRSNREPQVWGVGAGRRYPRSTDFNTALTPRDRDNTCYLCQIAKVRGFARATPGRNVEVDPTISQISTQVREPFPEGSLGEADGEPEAGVTARWGITPNLVASGTLNPDFSQVEADAFQLDVNERFALYYNEKRPFFYEGMEFFQTRLNSVYTRAIADPRWGFKLTGKEGGNAVGAFVAEDEITNLMFPSSEWSSQTSLETRSTAAVLRYRRDVGASSTIGAMLTSREGGGYSNRVGGVDGVLQLRDSDRLEFQGLMSSTAYPEEVAADYDQPEGEFDGGAYDVFYDHETGTWDWWLEYLEIGADLRADLGFRPQADYRQYRTGWSREWRGGPDTWYTSFDLGSGYVREETIGRDLMQGFFDAWLNYSGPARSSLNLYATTGTERYLGDEYDERYVWGQAGYWPTNALFVQLAGLYHQGIDYSNAQGGDRWGIRPTIMYKAGRLDVVYTHEFERMGVDAGRLYTANVDYLRAAYRFTRRAALRAIVQYLDYDFNPDAYTFEVAPEERCLASQVLLSYELNPQTVLYLGYSDNHEGTDVIELTQRDRTFFVKIGYAWVL